MDILPRLPADLFHHTMGFYDKRHPTAKVFGNFMSDMREFYYGLYEDFRKYGITDTCTQFHFMRDLTEEHLNSKYLVHSKPVLVDWLICGYQFKFQNEEITSANRCHFSRIELVWDRLP